MIGFDFDGVIQSDFNFVDVDQEIFAKVHFNCRPIFQPSGQYVIITGRHENEKCLEYINKYLLTKPLDVYYNKQKLDNATFKIETINALDIDIFYESCPIQTKLLCEAGINAICFPEFISKIITRG